MPGAFGLLETPNARVPPERFTASHPCADVHRLYREGLLVPGASARLETAHGGCLLASHEAGKIWIDGQAVVIGSHPALPQSVFICPVCQRTRYKLFEVGGRWACSRCHGLTRASRHTHRMLPGWHRLMRLRRKIGADPQPFTPIAPMPPRCKRYRRIVAEIRRIESGLITHLRADVCDVLQRRHDNGR